MGRIHVLSEHVANQIAAGEVVERPASVVKELLENSLDAGATRVRVNVEGGGKKLIQVIDDGCGMVRDDALLAFERHATSKLRTSDDLLSISTLGFRGEALPSIAAVSRLRLETHAPDDASGIVVEIAGGRILTVEEAGLPLGTSITIRDLFFNIPARRKFLKAETTELSHIASLVTHYALAHPAMHWELHTTANAMLVAPPVQSHEERIYQIFGKETLDQLIPLAAEIPLERIGLPKPPPWKYEDEEEEPSEPSPGDLRLHGLISKPEVQKLNRNSIYIFVNGRLIRDRLILHALTEAYRNIIPPTVFPVVLLFLEMPFVEVDVNVHPSKTEVRFRQQAFIHDFVRDSVRAALMKARPAPMFTTEINASAKAGASLSPTIGAAGAPLEPAEGELAPPAPAANNGAEFSVFSLIPPSMPPQFQNLPFQDGGFAVQGNAAIGAARLAAQSFGDRVIPQIPANPPEFVPETRSGCSPSMDAADAFDEPMTLAQLNALRPLGQLRDSYILAVNPQGLWIVDQHAAHERVLFETVLKQRSEKVVESQRLLMPIVVELSPAQLAIFGEISDELQRNGFEAELFGARTIAVKTAPAGVHSAEVERMLQELLEQFEREEQALNIEKARARIAASIACHAAIKVNMPLDEAKMEWLLKELSKTQYPMSCPHGRPVVLRYSVKDIQRAFKRI
jgi:DNA mismatch repair protein MutL